MAQSSLFMVEMPFESLGKVDEEAGLGLEAFKSLNHSQVIDDLKAGGGCRK